MTGQNLDDYLGLLSRDLTGAEILVFTGPSGSGKTSQIHLLLDRHPVFADMRPLWIRPGAPDFSRRACAGTDYDVLIIDEVLTLRHFLAVWPLVRRAPRLLAASHVPAWLFRLSGRRVLSLATDTSSEKLARFLVRENVAYSREDLADYVRSYGAVYTELQIMLEACPGSSLREIRERFQRFYRIDKVRACIR